MLFVWRGRRGGGRRLIGNRSKRSGATGTRKCLQGKEREEKGKQRERERERKEDRCSNELSLLLGWRGRGRWGRRGEEEECSATEAREVVLLEPESVEQTKKERKTEREMRG